MSETTLEFITLRQPERIRQKSKKLRYIRDLRSDQLAPLREQLTSTDVYGEKVVIARMLIAGPLFFSIERFYKFRFETIVDTLRESLIGPLARRDGTVTPGSELAALITLLEERVPVLGTSQFFHDPTLPPQGTLALFLQYATIWDSLHATAVMAGIHRVETNYLIDAIRAMHVLTVLRLENLKSPPPATWPYYDFDAYEAMLPGDLLGYRRLV